MKKLLIAALVAATPLLSGAAFAQVAEPDMVCLITFGSIEDAEAGADATALSGTYLSRDQANLLATESGGVSVVFDYSTTYPTNADEQAFCEGATFNPDEDNAKSAKDYAPGQLKQDGESAKDYAPGQQMLNEDNSGL
jgi:hypothetical protein